MAESLRKVTAGGGGGGGGAILSCIRFIGMSRQIG